MKSSVRMSNKIMKQLEHLGNTEQKRISDTLNRYPNVDRKKLWYLGVNASRVKCGKFRLIIAEDRGKQPELIFFGLRNDVYRRVRTEQVC